ncbi:hypothetical protein Q9233_011573 [Columba guinea]|nr:hypothetical protein Q9233_011573 [Columba guinea]
MSLTNTKTGFSVKDILDLPDTNDEDGSAAEGGEEESEAPEPPKKAGVLGQTPLDTVQTLPLKNPFYDNSDNPYTRWLASAEGIQYSPPQELETHLLGKGFEFGASIHLFHKITSNNDTSRTSKSMTMRVWQHIKELK